jgi:peroxiredoxin Q/BCP
MPPKRKSTGTEGTEKATKKAAVAGKGSSSKAVVGKVCPDLEFVLENGEETTLKELTKANGVVIFMYPRANTPGCTKQACGFRDTTKEFAAAGFDVYGLSYDKPKSQLSWKIKYDLPYHLLTDDKKQAIKCFGASKEVTKIKRSHIIIGKGGKVLDIANSVSPQVSFESALEFVQGL